MARLNRRQFLLMTAGTPFLVSGCSRRVLRPEEWPELERNDPLQFKLLRSRDNFSAELEVHGFIVKTRRGVSRLEALPGHKRLLVFSLPPQHFPESTISRSKLNSIVQSGGLHVSNPSELNSMLTGIYQVFSKRSQIVFEVPETDAAMPYKGKGMPLDLDHLLKWELFDFVSEDVSDPYVGDFLTDTTVKSDRRYFLGLEAWKGKGINRVTAIDLPAGFYLQPFNPGGVVWKTTRPNADFNTLHKTWSAFAIDISRVRSEPVDFELVDIWGVKGGTRASVEGNRRTYTYYSVPKSFRQIENPQNTDSEGADRATADSFENTAIDFYDRMELAVTLSPRFDPDVPLPSHPDSISQFRYFDGIGEKDCGSLFQQCYAHDHQIRAEVYGISADGGWIEYDNKWTTRPGCTISGASQKTSRGREINSRIARLGYLYCHGFECELVFETSREYLRDNTSHLVAPSASEYFIRRTNADFIPASEGESCFESLRLLTKRTPPLDVEHLSDRHNGMELKKLDAFVPMVDGEPYQFSIEARLLDGSTKTFSMPLMFVSNRQTSGEAAMFGRFPETPENGQNIPRNLLSWNDPRSDANLGDLNYVRVGGVQDICAQTGAVTNFIKLVDKIWERLDIRFAEMGGTTVPLARSVNAGDTSVEVKWVEFVRGRRPSALDQDDISSGKQYVDYVMESRVRTTRVALPGLRQFAGEVPDMLATYRDMRVRKDTSGNAAVFASLDPEETQEEREYKTGLLDPDVEGNDAGSFICVLPVGEADRAAILSTYYPGLIPSEERSLLFDGLANLVEFGRAKTSEGLGGLMTPDSPIALITRKFGPVGDKKQTIDDFRAAMGIGPSSIPSNGAAVTPYSTVRAHAIANGPNVSGAINLGIKDLLGDDAEIVPGIKITDIVNFILKSGDDQGGAAFQAFTNAPIPQEASASENAMQWQTRVTGIDWIYSLIGSSPGQITVSDAISLLLSQPIPDVGGEPLQFGAESSLYWVTEDFKELDAGVFTFAPENRSAKSGPNRSQFSVDALASINFLEPKPVIKAKSELSNFSITFLKALTVNFNYVRFEISELGKKEFTPSIGDVRFSGPLAFIDGLRELLKDLEDQFGLQIDVTPQRVSVSQIIAFPPSGPSVINLGPATIANLNFNWGVVIPIIGRDKMRVTAGLASRESPMVIAVGIYGGRSYAIFEADTSGPRLIEVSCDFGGVFEAEWSGVVRGSMSLTAGFAFVMRWDGNNQQSIELIAFSQFSGKLSVISLISVCANIYVALGYKTGAEGRVIYGIARASVSFKIVIKKYRVEWETYHEEVRKESSGNNGRSQRPRIYDYGDGSISNDQSSLRLNAAHVGAGFDGRAIPEQSESVDYFYPFGDSRMKKHWEDFFGAFKTS